MSAMEEYLSMVVIDHVWIKDNAVLLGMEVEEGF
jgi:hypothetical protein